MTHTTGSLVVRRIARLASVALALALAVGASVVAVDAGPRRARLSRDLSERLAARVDASTDIIVSGTDEQVQTLATRYGARVKKRLQNAAVLEVTGGQLRDLAEDADVSSVSGDIRVRTMSSVTAEAIGADQVWKGAFADKDGLRGFTGRGIGVAVIDTGVDARHPAVRSGLAVSLDFTGEGNRHRDENGHGTHIAGIIRDIAPGAHIVSLKAMGADGSGLTSNVIAAIEWAIENRRAWNIKIINVSLGHPVMASVQDDPLCQAVQRATDAGMLVTVAAGNVGKLADGTPVVGGISSPGNSPAALTVGALNTRQTAARSDDVMATYSSRGPTMIDGVLKPELVAPGNRILSAVPKDAYLPNLLPERVVGRGPETAMELSGTSMSAAVAAGAAALLLDARPMKPGEVKVVLQFTSSRVAGKRPAGVGGGEPKYCRGCGGGGAKSRYIR